MGRTFAATVALLALTASARACLWDEDTLAEEAADNMSFVWVIVGRFTRNPPLYYQMRIDREAPLVAKHPEQLDTYDNLGVAELRLGHADAALQWMTRKRAEMQRLGTRDKDAWYRTFANEGSFYAARWFAHGQDRKHTQDLLKAIEDVKKAIAINPNAHFGREPVQLEFLQWALKPGDQNFGETASWNTPGGYEDEPREKPPAGYPKSIEEAESNANKKAAGLAGLIRLGGAWLSPDIVAALGFMLPQRGYGQIASLAFFRTKELVANGAKPIAEDLHLDNQLQFYGENGPESMSWKFDEAQFKALRANADEWEANRASFMMGKLKAGRHPDTDPHFWDGYQPTPEIAIPDSPPDASLRAYRHLIIWRIEEVSVGIGAVIAALVVCALVRRRRWLREDPWGTA